MNFLFKALVIAPAIFSFSVVAEQVSYKYMNNGVISITSHPPINKPYLAV